MQQLEKKVVYDEEECPICAMPFEGERKKLFTLCKHCFCSLCLPQTLQIRPYCPLCQQYSPPGEYIDPYNENKQQQEQKIGNQFLKKHQEGQETAKPRPQSINKEDWNIQKVRAYLGEINAKGYKNVMLSDGQKTNIQVHQNAKIQVSPSANLVINGKKVENPQQCSQQ